MNTKSIKEVKKAMQVRISLEDWKRLKKIMHREEIDTLGKTVRFLIDFYEKEARKDGE